MGRLSWMSSGREGLSQVEYSPMGNVARRIATKPNVPTNPTNESPPRPTHTAAAEKRALEIFKELFLMMHPQGPEELNLVVDLALAQFHQEKEKKQSDGQVPKPNIPTNPTNECPPQTTPDEKRAMAIQKLTNVIKAEGPEQKFVAGLAAFLHD